MRRSWTQYVLGAVLAVLGIWFYLNFERVPVREHVGFQGEAARNPLLALTRLLERMGLEVRAPGDGSALPGATAGAALILPPGRAGYTAARAAEVRAWVEAGGHLIVQAEPPRMRDRVLDALNVRRGSSSGSPALATVTLPHAERPLKVQMRVSFDISDGEPSRTRFIEKAGTAGTVVLHLAAGRGRVSVVPSLDFMTNAAIGDHDHAALAWALLRLVPATSTVVIAPHVERPSVFGWLAENARAALAALALVLIVWGWRAASRFGPIAPEPVRERRRLLDHLRASGRFLWRSRAEPRLLAAARETCLHRIARTRPALLDLQPGERAERLAVLTDLPRRDILLALAAEPDTPAAFTAAVRTLQRIEEKLTRKPTGSR